MYRRGEPSPPSEGVLLAAARQREQLPKEVLDASFMVENIGHTTQQAGAFLARFRGYAAQQAELVESCGRVRRVGAVHDVELAPSGATCRTVRRSCTPPRALPR